MHTIHDRIIRKLKNFINSSSNKRFIQDTTIIQRQQRYAIPIKADHKGQIKGIVLDSSSSGETIFLEIEPIIEDNNKLLTLTKKEKEEEIKILKMLTSLIRDYCEDIEESLRFFIRFDIIYAKARYSIKIDGIKAVTNNEGIFKIYNAKHPLLSEDAVPIDILLGEEYKILILTGPNTGG